MSDDLLTGADIKAAGRQALKRRRRLRELQRSEVIAPQPLLPEHYHLVYCHPKSGTISTDWDTRYDSQLGAFRSLKALAERAEPNVEYYEDGQVGFETRVHGMLGQHWMIAAVGLCTRQTCRGPRPLIEIITPT